MIPLSMLEFRFGLYILYFKSNSQVWGNLALPRSHHKQHCIIVWYQKIGLGKYFFLMIVGTVDVFLVLKKIKQNL